MKCNISQLRFCCHSHDCLMEMQSLRNECKADMQKMDSYIQLIEHSDWENYYLEFIKICPLVGKLWLWVWCQKVQYVHIIWNCFRELFSFSLGGITFPPSLKENTFKLSPRDVCSLIFFRCHLLYFLCFLKCMYVGLIITVAYFPLFLHCSRFFFICVSLL